MIFNLLGSLPKSISLKLGSSTLQDVTLNTLDFANERQIKVGIIAIAFFFIGPVAIPSISPIALGILTATVANKVLK